MKTIVTIIVKTIMRIGKPRWVVFSDGDPGFVLFGVPVSYYKWNDSFVVMPADEKYRLAEKHELAKSISF